MEQGESLDLVTTEWNLNRLLNLKKKNLLSKFQNK